MNEYTPRPNTNIRLNPHDTLLMKNRMRLTNNLMNSIPRTLYDSKS